MAERPDDGVTGAHHPPPPTDPENPDYPDDRTADKGSSRQDQARGRRLEEVFGDVLPDTTGDERGRPSSRKHDDEHLRREVPPHHG
jgi:hypothetical protein